MPRKVPKRKPRSARKRAGPTGKPGQLDIGALLSSPDFVTLLGLDSPDLPPGDPSEHAIDPGLMPIAIACLASDAEPSGSGDVLYAATRAYAAYYDKDEGRDQVILGPMHATRVPDTPVATAAVAYRLTVSPVPPVDPELMALAPAGTP